MGADEGSDWGCRLWEGTRDKEFGEAQGFGVQGWAQGSV